MGQLRWISVLATASAAASWLCTAGAWKLYRSHDLAVNGSFEASDSFLEAQWGQPYVDVPGTKNSDGSVSFVFAQAVNGYVAGHEPPKTPEGSGSTGNAGSNGESSNVGQGGSTEDEEGSSGSTQGPPSSGSVESAPSGGATGNGGTPTSPENGGASSSEVVLRDFVLGSCDVEGMTGTGPSEFQIESNIQSLQTCHEICLDNDRCNWYTYNVNTKKCYLKGERGPMRPGPAGDFTSPKYCDSSCYRKNRQVVGTEISKDLDPSAFFCHYRCHMNSSCRYWSWHRISTQCQLFSDAGVEGVRLVQDIVSGPRSGCGREAKPGEELHVPEHVVGAPSQEATGSTQGPFPPVEEESSPTQDGSTQGPSPPVEEESSTAGGAGNGVAPTLPDEENKVEEEEVELQDVVLGPCRFENMSVTGPGEYTIRGGVQTLQACHEMCLKEDRCKWYTYNTPNKKCYLKANAGPLKHVIPGDTTSPKYCDSSCYIKNKKLLGTLLEALTGRLTTAFTCHYECHFRSDCYYWSWDSKTLDCHLFSGPGLQGKKVAQGFVSGPRDGCGVEAKEGGVSAIP